ncbi:MAG: HdeD family acid-resistance protein [Ruminococcus sp.]
MISENYTKAAKTGYIVLSVLLGALGVLLITVPDFSLTLAARICGGTLAAFGIFRLIGYFSKDLYRLAFQYDLAFGILLLNIGAVILFRPGGAIHFISAVLGVYILADGLMKVQISLDAKRFGLHSWIWILIAALSACIAGIIMLFRPAYGARILTVLLGTSLLLEGILNLLTALTAVKLRNKNNSDIIDADYTEDMKG